MGLYITKLTDMAIKKHALTKTGAIVAITREQLRKIKEQGLDPNSKRVQENMGINKTFVDTYMSLQNSKVKELYKEAFGVELVIVNERKDGK